MFEAFVSSSVQVPNLPADWLHFLEGEFSKEYMLKLKEFLVRELEQGKTIYPRGKDIFNAFNLTPLKDVKVVIFGQDPYHGPDQAHGLCFSVQPGIKTPPSLKNIYKEIQQDLGIAPAEHGHLDVWAKQGVLLLNAVLTVEATKAASHQKKGWEQFTDKVVEVLNEECEHLVFMLWGSHAQKKGRNIDTSKHLVLKSVHPSPLSAHRGFFGCKHFSKANEYLQSVGKDPIDWTVPPLH
jgi:uracil-DNA glycosylase